MGNVMISKRRKIIRRPLYLKKLRIQNFQSYKDTTFDLHPGVNIFLGETDVGKSAIERALEAIVFSTFPKGFRLGYKDDTVLAATVGSNKVTRIKSNTKNDYVIEGQDVFKKVGEKVPPEVRKILNFGPINFQGQFDSAYLFGDTAGGVAKTINKLTRLEDLDKLVSDQTTRLFKLNTTHELKVKEVNEEEDNLSPYLIVDKVKGDVEDCIEKNDQLQELEKHLEELDAIINDIRKIDHEIDYFTDIEEWEQAFEVAQEEAGHIQVLEERFKEIDSITMQLRGMELELNSLEKDLPDYEKEVNQLMTELTVLQKEEEHADELEDLCAELRTIENKLTVLKPDVDEKEGEFFTALNALKICPLCEQKVTKENLKMHSMHRRN